jgi:type II secretory pathway pseudopilin PulG
MKLDSRLLTLLGALVIVAVLGLGTVLAALPMYGRVQSAQQEISQTQATNATLDARRAELSRAKERQAEIETGIATLRKQLPTRPESDTVLQVIAEALTAHEVFPRTDRFGDSMPYSARTGSSEGEQPAAAPAPAPEPTPEAAEEDGAAAEDAAASQAEAAAAEPPSDPRQQIEITLEVGVPDEGTATAFLDTLRSGSRLLLVTGATLERSEDQETGMQGKLTVTMLSFYRTEAAS